MTTEQRLARLERQNRWMRTALLALVMAGAGAIIMGQATSKKVPELIRAKKFQVVDDSGSPLAHTNIVIDSVSHHPSRKELS